MEYSSGFMLLADLSLGSRHGFGEGLISSCASVVLSVIFLSSPLLVDLLMVIMLVFGSQDEIPVG